jgi:hypothetical protein
MGAVEPTAFAMIAHAASAASLGLPRAGISPCKVRFYAITTAGRRQLTAETENWKGIAGVIARLLRRAEQP